MTAEAIKMLHAGERLSKESGIFADIMHDDSSDLPPSILPVLNVGLQGESGVAAATIPQLSRIVAKVRHNSANN